MGPVFPRIAHRSHRSRWMALCLVLCASAVSACGHEIGDDCTTTYDCSQQGSRTCDRTQRGGYCTITPCERGSCPKEATCVEFRPKEDRLAQTYCMRRCSENNDCRDDEGYRCTTATDFSVCGDEAKTLDGNVKFCANAPAAPPADAGAETNMCIDPSGA